MGARANYIIINKDGSYDLFRNRWGAEFFNDIFLLNFDDLISFIRSNEETDFIYSRCFCEAGILVDFFSEEILFFGGNLGVVKSCRDRVFTPILQKKWNNFSVREVDFGSITFAERINYLDMEYIKEGDSFDQIDYSLFNKESINKISTQKERNIPFEINSELIITIAENNNIKDYRINISELIFFSDISTFPFLKIISQGNKIFDLVNKLDVFSQLPNENYINSSIFIDKDKRKLYYWSTYTLEEITHKLIQDKWEEWGVKQHFNGYPYHVELTGRNYSSILINDFDAKKIINSKLDNTYFFD